MSLVNRGIVGGGLVNVAPVRSRVVSGTFAPTDIAGLQVWYKADGTRWQDSARTTPATADTDPIGAWDDASGNGNHAVQTIDNTFRPLLRTGVINGLAVARFDGSNDFLRRTFGAALSQPGTVFIVGKTDTSGTNDRKLFDGVTGGRWLLDESGGVWRLYAGSLMTGGTPNDVFNYHTCILNGASSSHRLNGAASFSGDAGTGSLAGITLGNDDALTTPLFGDIAEFLIFNSAITGTNLTNMESYLASKFAL